MLLVLFVDRRFDGRTRPEVSRHKTAGGEENERNPQRPRSVQQRLRLKGKSERGRRKDAVLLLSHNLSAGALGTGDAAGPASICSWELRVKAPLNQTSTDSSYAHQHGRRWL